MPKAYPEEFRRDVIAVARRKEVPMRQDRQGLRDLGDLPAPVGPTSRDRRRRPRGPAEEAQIRELKKRNRLLEQENEVLRRAATYLGQGLNPNDLPAGPRACR